MKDQDPVDVLTRSLDNLYEKCERGITCLDRIIVSAPDSDTSRTRMYLVPALYSYWERFFKTALMEYLRAVSRTGLIIDNIDPSLARTYYCVGLQHIQGKAKKVKDPISKQSIVTICNQLQVWANNPVDFNLSDDTTWVKTDSNVNYRAVTQNCNRLGLNHKKLAHAFGQDKTNLKKELNAFVDERNAIAHGSDSNELAPETWERYKVIVLKLMGEIQDLLCSHLSVTIAQSIPDSHTRQ